MRGMKLKLRAVKWEQFRPSHPFKNSKIWEVDQGDLHCVSQASEESLNLGTHVTYVWSWRVILGAFPLIFAEVQSPLVIPP